MDFGFTNYYSECKAEVEAMRQRAEAMRAGPFGYRMGQKIEAEPDEIDPNELYIRYVKQKRSRTFRIVAFGLHSKHGAMPNSSICIHRRPRCVVF